MTPTAGQTAAMALIQAFMLTPVDNDDLSTKVATISGVAGSGKTSLIEMIRDHFAHAIIAAPTNKAVNVLRQKGFKKATTVDRVLKQSVYVELRRPPTKEEREFHVKEGIPIPEFVIVESYEKIVRDNNVVPLLVVDEASMTNLDDLANIILNFPKVVFVGDGFQLPPVQGDAWFQVWNHTIHLDEIVRTAATSEITMLASMIRLRDPRWRTHQWSHDVTVLKASVALARDQLWHDTDIVLAHQNKTCDRYNSMIRSIKGLTRDSDQVRPVAGDRLLAWEAMKAESIVKSDIYDVLSAGEAKGGYIVRLKCPNTGNVALVTASKANLLHQTSEIRVSGLRQFSFAHCITAHKSQGSEWDNVVVLALDKNRSHEDYWNWLYTAATRAKCHLTILV